jgi:hypothetical protein
MDARTVELWAAATNRRATSCARAWLGLALPTPPTSSLSHRRQIIAHVPAIPAEPSSPMITVSAALAFRTHRCENTPDLNDVIFS